jgi:NAD+ diphosphatase
VSLTTFFSGGDINRLSWQRADHALVEKKRYAPSARYLLTRESDCLTDAGVLLLLTRKETESIAPVAAAIFLGSRDEQDIFVLDLPDDFAASVITSRPSANFTALLSTLAERDAALLAYAKGMVEWHRRHQHCGTCGAANAAIEGGSVMRCSSADCAHRSFPQLDPAIIVLVAHGPRCLLGRQVSWPEGRFSTLAGFVEPGESLEDAVQREVYEETSVRVTNSTYLGSQPWPFPSSLMVGFHAEAATTDIRLIDGELAEARWFDRAELARGAAQLPPPTSIAFQLIERWFDAADGPRLATLNVTSSYSSRAIDDQR